MAGIMAINTNIEGTKNIIWSEYRNLFEIASLLLIICEFRRLLELLIVSVVDIIVSVFLNLL